MVTRSGWFRMWVVCGSFLRYDFARTASWFGGAAGRRCSGLTPDPCLVESRSYGGRQGDPPGSRLSSGRSDDSLYAKGNLMLAALLKRHKVAVAGRWIPVQRRELES